MKLFLIILFLLNPFLFSQNTEVYIGVETSVDKNLTELVIYSFKTTPEDRETERLKEEISNIIRSDILFSGYFKLIEENNSTPVTKNIFKYYSKISDYLLIFKLDYDKELRKINLTNIIYNTQTKEKISAKTYSASISALRNLSHTVSNDIIRLTTGQIPIATSKIAFSNNSTGHKEIYIIDYDGENLIQLTNHRSISIIPKWSPDDSKIYYTSYRRGNPDLYMADLKKGIIKPFSRFQGLNIAGGFSPDGNEFVVTLSRGRDPSIYIIDLVKREVKKLLDRFGVSSSPTYSPDGNEIAFVSDKAGNPSLYIYNLTTKTYRRLTDFNWVDSPSWSKNGKWIAFSGRKTRFEKFNIFIMDPTTGIIKRLTRNEGDNEDPSFSPDSRFIAFTSTRRGRREIFIMDIDGSRPHLLSEKIKGHSFTPIWSNH